MGRRNVSEDGWIKVGVSWGGGKKVVAVGGEGQKREERDSREVSKEEKEEEGSERAC